SRLEFAARAADSSEEQQREARRRSNRRAEDSERGSEDEDEDEEDEEEDAEEEEDGDSLAGTKVRVKYGRGKTQKIYEAHIKKTDSDSGEQFYLVHYYGWNVRYDEWVKADRIIWPSEKGTKRRQRKKVKNKDKDEAERDDEKVPIAAPLKPTGAKRGRPQSRTTPTGSAGRGLARLSGGDGQSNGRSAGDGVPGIANGDDTPHRRTRRTSGVYDSDRASVGENRSPEDSGSSSNDSESEEKPPKSSPWRGRAESECDQPEEEEPEAEEMKEEAEQGEEPIGEASMMSSQSDKESRTLPAVKTMPLPNKNKLSPGQEALHATSPSKAPALPPPNTPPPPVSSIPATDEDSRSALTSSPRVRDEAQENSEDRLSAGDEKRPESCTGTAPTVSGMVAPAPHEEQEPQIGPEALVCHEVDLDDPDEREKPASAENLLLLMRDQQAPPPRLSVHSSSPAQISPPPLQTQVRSYILTPTTVPCPEELQPANTGAEPALTRAEQEDDSSPGFTGSTSPSSTSLVSLQDTKDRGQKRGNECNSSPSAKKHKRSQKRPNTPGKSEKNGAGDFFLLFSGCAPSGRVVCVQEHAERGFTSVRINPAPLASDDLDSMTSAERISFLQDKLQEIRKYYMSLKSEVASIDRRRKRLKKKEREVSNTTVSTSSGSSDTGMSPSSASPAQNAVAVECR
uniref:Tudor-knot domain-containing protein n=1 Tax=Oryzias latipes TaxID=8090 RepID=H2M348_ORYLA